MENKKQITNKIKKETKKKDELAVTLTAAPIKKDQLLFILQKTPKQHIYTRKGKGGGTFDYVTGVYVKKALNYVFGWMWDFNIVDKGREGDLVWVQGRLTIKNKSGKEMIVKEQFGRADIKFLRGTKTPVDYGNDLKAAATDALKKCASELGIASDVYGKQEFQEIQKEDKGFIPPEVEVTENKEETKTDIISGKKTEELKRMLNGNNDREKIIDLKKRTGISIDSFNISERHAGILVASLLNVETENGK